MIEVFASLVFHGLLILDVYVVLDSMQPIGARWSASASKAFEQPTQVLVQQARILQGQIRMKHSDPQTVVEMLWFAFARSWHDPRLSRAIRTTDFDPHSLNFGVFKLRVEDSCCTCPEDAWVVPHEAALSCVNHCTWLLILATATTQATSSFISNGNQCQARSIEVELPMA